ncbi:hypothetical protein L596_014659 [Steinernema carpocapsae]|uniref:G-protein coupled receptors family 1 profile domain-containing protein n=1 Tax=Steinernema carpocapsae TaxID=34508 RepID=A0A4U5NCJ1_STECR|nr:hypothetical protein L596_014659 [Steinernema carpocapsae]
MHSEADPLVSTLIGVGLLVSVADFLIATMLFHLAAIDKKFHGNFSYIQYSICVSFFVLILATFLDLILLANGDFAFVSPSACRRISLDFRATGFNLLTVTFFVTFLERTAATVFSHLYEHHRLFHIRILSFVAQAIFTPLLTLYSRIWNISRLTICIVSVSLALMIALLMVVLMHYNQRLRQITFDSNVVLTQRYQITENIRAISLIYPVIFGGLVAQISFWTVDLATILYDRHNFFTFYAQIMVSSIYILAMPIIVISNDRVNKRRILQYSLCRRLNCASVLCCGSQVSADENSDLGAVVVIRNVSGKRINRVETQNTHFDFLNSMWK